MLSILYTPKGENLHHLLHIRKHSLSINQVISIGSQIAKGMGYLHARQIVHRDLKTRNIFIETNYKAVIADFALFNFVNFCKVAKYVVVPLAQRVRSTVQRSSCTNSLLSLLDAVTTYTFHLTGCVTLHQR